MISQIRPTPPAVEAVLTSTPVSAIIAVETNLTQSSSLNDSSSAGNKTSASDKDGKGDVEKADKQPPKSARDPMSSLVPAILDADEEPVPDIR